MTDDERPAVLAHLQAAATLFRRRLPDEAAEFYLKAVENEPGERIIAALDRIGKNAEGDSKFPMPKELAARVQGAWHEPTRKLTDPQAGGIRQHVFADMATWEREDGQGSARPAFERAWYAALRAYNLRDPKSLVEAREATWKSWLHATPADPDSSLPPLETEAIVTRPRMSAILREAATRAAPGVAQSMHELAASIDAGIEPTPTPASAGLLDAALVQAVVTILDAEPLDAPPASPEPSLSRNAASEPPDTRETCVVCGTVRNASGVLVIGVEGPGFDRCPECQPDYEPEALPENPPVERDGLKVDPAPPSSHGLPPEPQGTEPEGLEGDRPPAADLEPPLWPLY
jgi:hypothetical protein